MGLRRSAIPRDEDRGWEQSAFRGIGAEPPSKHWSGAGPIRDIFKRAFAAAGLPYFNPHSFRKTLALLGGHICKSPEEYKAWSQNLGHENVLTTFSSYGDVARHRQAEIIRALGKSAQHACIQPAVP